MSARLAVDMPPVAFAALPRALRAMPPPVEAPPSPGARAAASAPPRLRALLAASGAVCDGMLLLRPAAAGPGVPRLLRALAEAHALAHGGHALAGLGQALLVLAPAAGLPGLAAEMRLLDPGLDSRLFRLPAESGALVAAAAPWFSAGSGARPAATPQADSQAAPRREPIAAITRGLPPSLLGFRLVGGAEAMPDTGSDPGFHPGPGPQDLWQDLRPGNAPPPGFSGTALVSPVLVAEPAILAIWRDRLAADGGRLAIGPFGPAELRWLDLAAIPAHLLLLHWSQALPDAYGPNLPTDRIVLTGADRPEALAWGLGAGIGAYAGTVVDALLAARRLAACPAAHGCDAGACAARAAATTAAGRAGCANPVLLARWAP